METCERCGALVGSLITHQDWHDRMEEELMSIQRWIEEATKTFLTLLRRD